jgi:hypothetical protein
MGEITVLHGIAFLLELLHHRCHVDRIPDDDGICDQIETQRLMGQRFPPTLGPIKQRDQNRNSVREGTVVFEENREIGLFGSKKFSSYPWISLKKFSRRNDRFQRRLPHGLSLCQHPIAVLVPLFNSTDGGAVASKRSPDEKSSAWRSASDSERAGHRATVMRGAQGPLGATRSTATSRTRTSAPPSALPSSLQAG